MHCDFAYLADDRDDLNYPYDADDFTTGIIRFADGSSLNTSMSFASNRVQPDELAEDGLIKSSEWLDLGIYGSKAGVDVGRKRLVSHAEGGVIRSDLTVADAFADMPTDFDGLLADFAAAIKEGREALNSATQALQLMQILDALKLSAETGRSVDIGEVASLTTCN